jgi:hypothetical protein
MTSAETQLETTQPPNLDEFVARLADPEYIPPEYIPAADQPGGFYAPGYRTPEDTGAVASAIVRLDNVENRTGWRYTPGLHCRYDDTGEPFVTNARAIDAITARLGHRKLAVDLFVHPVNGEVTITGVHGVEPPYCGGPIDPNTHPRDILVEGRVVEVIPQADTAATFPSWSSADHVPLMRVQLDPDDPTQTMLVPMELLTDVVNPDHRTRASVGDTVQIRTSPRMYDTTAGPLMLPSSLSGQRYSRSATSILLREGEARTAEREQQQTETEQLLAAIEHATSPQQTAILVNTYIYSRYRFEPHVDLGVVHDMSRLAIAPQEMNALVTALAAKGWPPHDMPAFLRPALYAGNAYIDVSTHPVGRLYHMQSFLREHGLLTDAESIETMTAADIGSLAEHYAEQRFYYLDNPDEYGPPDYRLETLFQAMGPETTERAITAILEQMGDLPQYRLFWQTSLYMIADMYNATESNTQAHELIRLVCNNARSEEDLIGLLEMEYGKNGDRLFSMMLDTAHDAAYFEASDVRDAAQVTIDEYLEMVATAQAFLRMLDVLGDSRDDYIERRLRPEQADRIADLDDMGI